MDFIVYTAAGWIWTMAAIALVMGAWRMGDAVSRAPGLDIAVSLMTWVPWVVLGAMWGWWGVLGCFIGQCIGLQTFCALHWNLNRPRRPKGSIRRTLDRVVGPVRNHLGLWLTVPALPIFLAIRAGEILFYGPLLRVTGFPAYRHADWVNVSRQKFQGLLGHDLVWCLYCDWMTGVYSLGAEMLRNVESFWCPIRFYPGKKCENCKLDFPDIDRWVAPDATLKEVDEALMANYGDKPPGQLGWWGRKETKR